MPSEQRDRGTQHGLNDLSAAVGRVQLKSWIGCCPTPDVARAIHEGLKKRSRVVTPGWQPEGAEASYWFLRLHVDTSQITVSGDRFASAIGAEGIPVAPSYRCRVPGARDVAGGKARLGLGTTRGQRRSRQGDPERQSPVPNAVPVLDYPDFNIHILESCGEQEIADILTAIEKVEQAYCKNEAAAGTRVEARNAALVPARSRREIERLLRHDRLGASYRVSPRGSGHETTFATFPTTLDDFLYRPPESNPSGAAAGGFASGMNSWSPSGELARSMAA